MITVECEEEVYAYRILFPILAHEIISVRKILL